MMNWSRVMCSNALFWRSFSVAGSGRSARNLLHKAMFPGEGPVTDRGYSLRNCLNAEVACAAFSVV